MRTNTTATTSGIIGSNCTAVRPFWMTLPRPISLRYRPLLRDIEESRFTGAATIAEPTPELFERVAITPRPTALVKGPA
jgi:hypothetical protein